MAEDESRARARDAPTMQASLTAICFPVESDRCPEPTPTSRLTASMRKLDEDAYRKFHSQYAGRLFRYLLILSRGDE